MDLKYSLHRNQQASKQPVLCRYSATRKDRHQDNGDGEGSAAVSRTFRASVDELGAILEEIPWDIHKLLNLVRHGCELAMV